MAEMLILIVVLSVVFYIMLGYIKASIDGKIEGSLKQLGDEPYLHDLGRYNVVIQETVKTVRTIDVENESENSLNKIITDKTVGSRSVDNVKQFVVEI